VSKKKSHCKKGHDLSINRKTTINGQTYCGICKKITDKNKDYKSEHQKNIRRRGYLKRKYGITILQYKALYKKQKGLCAICTSSMNEFGKDTHIDHCHKSQAIRGLLCRYCNVGLGNFKDDVFRFKKAIAYLRKHKK